MLQAKNISCSHENETILHGISCEIKEREIVAIVGESGCGKTTFLRCLAGLHDLDEGQITFDEGQVEGPTGKLIAGHPGISMVLQDFGLYPNNTIEENIAGPLRYLEKGEKAAKVGELLKLTALEKHVKKRPGKLSGGQKQRAALAVALAENPKLMLLDEPFSQLDPILIRRIKTAVVRILKEQKASAAFVLHDPHDALAMADRVFVMQHGKIIQQGTPAEVYEHPVNPYVAQLFGEASFLPVKWLQNIDQKLYEKLDINKGRQNQDLMLRPENLHISTKDNGFSGEIKGCYYQGGGYLTEVEVAQKNFKAWSPHKRKAGSQASLTIQYKNGTKPHLVSSG